MLVVSAGRGRSGSTLLYNLIRLSLIEVYGTNNVHGRSYRHYDKESKCKYHVVKIHGHNKYLWKNANFVFSCRRDKDQQRRSTFKHQKLIKGVEKTDEEIDKLISNDYIRYKKWKTHKNFVCTFEFEDLIKNKYKVLDVIAKVLGFKLDAFTKEKIINNLNNLKLPNKGYDKETCLTRHHFTSKGMKNG